MVAYVGIAPIAGAFVHLVPRRGLLVALDLVGACLAHDTEALTSPMLAATLLSVIGFRWLFAGPTLGFLASALLVLSIGPALAQAGDGCRRCLGAHDPRRAQLPGDAAAARAVGIASLGRRRRRPGGREHRGPGAGRLRAGARKLAWALATYGGGSMTAAPALPRVPDRVGRLSVGGPRGG